MWGSRYWGPRYWGPRYWGRRGDEGDPEPETLHRLYYSLHVKDR